MLLFRTDEGKLTGQKLVQPVAVKREREKEINQDAAPREEVVQRSPERRFDGNLTNVINEVNIGRIASVRTLRLQAEGREFDTQSTRMITHHDKLLNGVTLIVNTLTERSKQQT